MDNLISILELWVLINVVVFIHEFAHALTAKALDIYVEYIKIGFIKLCQFTVLGIKINLGLMPLGGTARIEEAPQEEAYKNILIALAGPLVSFGTALIFMFVATPQGPFYPFTGSSIFGLFFNTIHQVISESNILTIIHTVQVLNSKIGVVNAFFLILAVSSFGASLANLFPIPGLDGARIVSSIVIMKIGERAKRPLNLVNFASLSIMLILTMYFFLIEFWLFFR